HLEAEADLAAREVERERRGRVIETAVARWLIAAVVEEVDVAQVAVADLLAFAEEDQPVLADVGAPEPGGEVVRPHRVDLHREREPASLPARRLQRQEAPRGTVESPLQD